MKKAIHYFLFAIIATMRQMAKDALNNYQQEGTDLPSFSLQI